MPGQSEDIDEGGTLRLGSYPCVIAAGTTMARCYRNAQIQGSGTATAMNSTTTIGKCRRQD